MLYHNVLSVLRLQPILKMNSDPSAISEPAPEPVHRPAAPKVSDVERCPEGQSSLLSKTMLNFWLDCFLLLNFMVLAWISAVIQIVFPAAHEAAGWTLWGRDIVAWQNYQFGSLCVFAIAITLHVMLHWTWVCGVINKRLLGRNVLKSDGTDTLVGVGLIAALLHILGIGVLLAKWAILRP